MKSKLIKLEELFASNIWQRGKEYYREGLVGNVIKVKDIIKAESYGNSTYRLKINLKNKDMSCSCPCDFYCKHLAALIMWLKKNKPIELSKQEDLLKSKTKSELITVLTRILEQQPNLSIYLQSLDEKAILDLIKKIWIPRYEYDRSFFDKLEFIKEEVLKKKKSELIITFLRKLIDLSDHDPDSYELHDYIDRLLDKLSQEKLPKKLDNDIRKIIEEYPFEY